MINRKNTGEFNSKGVSLNYFVKFYVEFATVGLWTFKLKELALNASYGNLSEKFKYLQSQVGRWFSKMDDHFLVQNFDLMEILELDEKNYNVKNKNWFKDLDIDFDKTYSEIISPKFKFAQNYEILNQFDQVLENLETTIKKSDDFTFIEMIQDKTKNTRYLISRILYEMEDYL